MSITLEDDDYFKLQKLLKGNDMLDNSDSDTDFNDSVDEQSPTRSRRSNISSNKL